MLLKGSVVRFVALAAVIVLVGATISEAQGRRQRGNRQGGGSRFGQFGRRGGGSLAILKNEYLQKELNFTAAQKKRVVEIDIQMAGAGALQREDIQKTLGITAAQKEKMKSIQDGVQKKVRDSFGGNNGGGRRDFTEIFKKIGEIRKAAEKETLTVLTSTQVAAFNRMKGKAVDVSKLRPQRQGGGRRPAPKRPEI